MSTSSPTVSEGTSICQCDALSTGTNSITQCPASLSLSATLVAPTQGVHQTHTHINNGDWNTHGHMDTCTICDAKMSHMYHMYHKNTYLCRQKGRTFGTSISTLRKITQRLPSPCCPSISVILFHSFSHSFTCWPVLTHTHHTPTHITSTRAHSSPSLPLYISRRAHHNGCTSPESFSTDTCVALSLMNT